MAGGCRGRLWRACGAPGCPPCSGRKFQSMRRRWRRPILDNGSEKLHYTRGDHAWLPECRGPPCGSVAALPAYRPRGQHEVAGKLRPCTCMHTPTPRPGCMHGLCKGVCADCGAGLRGAECAPVDMSGTGALHRLCLRSMEHSRSTCDVRRTYVSSVEISTEDHPCDHEQCLQTASSCSYRSRYVPIATENVIVVHISSPRHWGLRRIVGRRVHRHEQAVRAAAAEAC